MMTFSNTFFLEVIFYTRKEEEQYYQMPSACHSSRQKAASLESEKPDSQQGTSNRQGPALLKPDSFNSRLHLSANQVFAHFIGRAISDQ